MIYADEENVAAIAAVNTVQVLKCARSNGPAPGPALLYMNGYDEDIDINVHLFVIKTPDDGIIVVDTGLGYPSPRDDFIVEPDEDTPDLLKSIGVLPTDVDALILTHLHSDHCSRVADFPNATIYIQREGWIDAVCPRVKEMIPAPLFPRDVFAHLVDEAWDRVEFVDDELEISPGVTAFWTGAHTTCSQAVEVLTASGVVILSGDAVFLYRNLEENIPVGLHTSVEECYHAMSEIRERADIVLTSHDPEVFERYPTGLII